MSVSNNQYQWSIDFKDIPFFLSVLDNRNRARHPILVLIIDMIICYLLLMITVNLQFIVTGNLRVVSNHRLLVQENYFRKIQVHFWNHLLFMKYTIAVYVRRFEQRSHEIEYLKLTKAGLPIMKGEQVCFEIFKILNI